MEISSAENNDIDVRRRAILEMTGFTIDLLEQGTLSNLEGEVKAHRFGSPSTYNTFSAKLHNLQMLYKHEITQYSKLAEYFDAGNES